MRMFPNPICIGIYRRPRPRHRKTLAQDRPKVAIKSSPTRKWPIGVLCSDETSLLHLCASPVSVVDCALQMERKGIDGEAYTGSH